jgi:DNA-binding FadR family transcriptional regulator
LRWLNNELAAAAERSDAGTMAELNVRFHEALCQAAHNGMLLQFVRQIHDWVRQFGGTTFSYPKRSAAAVLEHARVLAAIEAHDPDEAERLAREHMTRARQVRIAMLRGASKHKRGAVANARTPGRA